MGPPVTIGMPVFNGYPHIKYSIDSLLKQKFSQFELIISDNASTDATDKICKEYSEMDSRVRYIRQSANFGPFDNFKFVLDAAKSKYFMWAASDDLWSPLFLKKCFDSLEDMPEIDFSFTQYSVRSRLIDFIRIDQFPDMSFVFSDDPIERVTKFLNLDTCTTHKANFMYSLWRKPILQEYFSKLYDEFVTMNGLDIALLTYILMKHKCYQADGVHFYKLYKKLPPGHKLSEIIHKILNLKFFSLNTNEPSDNSLQLDKLIFVFNETGINKEILEET